MNDSRDKELDASLITELRGLMDEKDTLEARKKAINGEIRAIKSKLLQSFEAQDVTSVRVDGVGLAYVEEKVYGKVTDQGEARASLLEAGRDEIIVEKISDSRLSSFVKELLQEGEAIPAGITYTEARDIKVRRS